MRNIVLSLILVVALLAGGITGAFATWVDDGDDYGVCWTAGFVDIRVDLSVDGVDTWLDPGDDLICETHLEPGDSGEITLSLHVNSDRDPEPVDVTISATITDFENGQVEPEVSAGDDSPGVSDGELSEFLAIKIWVDEGYTAGWQGHGNDTEEGDNIWQDGECVYYEDTLANLALDSLQFQMIPCDVWYIGISWLVTGTTPGDADVCMTDSVSGTVTISAAQQHDQ